MKTIEIIYACLVAIFSLHFFFMWKFWRGTEKGTKFDPLKWIKENIGQYIFSWMGMLLWLMVINWDIVFAYYAKLIIKMPYLEVFKAHAMIAFVAGFFNTRLWAALGKKVAKSSPINLEG